MEEDVDSALHRRLWQKPWFVVLAVFGAGVLLTAAVCLDVPGFLRGHTDLFGNYVFEEEREEARDVMTPMERVHAELFPHWLIAQANRRPDAPAQFAALREALTDDALRVVADELHAAAQNGAIARAPVAETDAGSVDAGPVDADVRPPYELLLARWNARLKELDEPFYVTGSVSGTPAGPALICEFYRHLASPSVVVGDLEVPTVILQRIDRTNIVESYLGVAHRGGTAIVVTDRILDLATDDVWLMLHAETQPAEPLAQAYATAIRAEAEVGLGASTVATLAGAAIHRRAILDTVASVLDRRSCGNTMQFGTIAWDGMNPRTLDRLDAYAERDKIQPCPTMTFAEADALRAASEALQSDTTKQALEALVAWLTRMIALHEARHVADELELGRLDDPASCPGCPARMHRSTRAELSAYVASFAWSDSPATAMYQACTVRGGPHGRAMRFVNAQLGRRCTDPPPADLAQRAQELQQVLLGIAPPMELPQQFPSHLEIHRFR